MRHLLLLLAGGLSFIGCRQAPSPPSPPRVLHIRAVGDTEFRKRDNWRTLIESRVQAASRYYQVFDITWVLESVGEWSPDPQAAPEVRRRQLAGTQTDGNWVYIGFGAAQDDAADPGIAIPFDSRVLVYDYPAKTEAENAAVLAHQVAHVFGAWHSNNDGSLMHVPPGGDFDRTAAECIRLARGVDLRNGIDGLSGEALTGVSKLWTDSASEPSSNPVYRFYAAHGHELLNSGAVDAAMDPLTKAIKQAPKEPQPHFSLAAAYMARGRFRMAAAEYQKVTELLPQSSIGFNDLGRALLQAGQPEQALDALLQAQKLSPDNAAIQANLGIALSRISGRLDEGIVYLRKAVSMNPNDENLKAALNAALAAGSRGRK
jgi:tetratricopeptide (TPR) repeat protein